MIAYLESILGRVLTPDEHYLIKLVLAWAPEVQR